MGTTKHTSHTHNDAADRLNRSLHARHMRMIAIGGAIGTGLFLASGATISQAGPGGALLAYALIGFVVLMVMQSLGEMSTHLPVAGSFEVYASRYVSPSFGFATGWNYWFNWAITLAAELVAAGLVMRFWFPDVPGWVWAAVFLILLTTINALSARAFGESEFWFALIKVVTVLVFLVLGVLMIIGIIGGPSPGFHNWTTGEAPFVGGPWSTIAVFMVAGFSFQGTELVGVAAGESKNPRRDMPKAIRGVFWRIMIFYIAAIAVIGFLLPYTDPSLLAAANDEDITASPFTLVFDRAGIALAAGVMNAVILTAILSAGNSGLYSSTRMLYALAESGRAPKIFTWLSKRRVPVPALLTTAAIGGFAFTTHLMGEGQAYTWLLNISALCGFTVWAGISWSHLRFRRAFVKQGHSLSELPYKAPLYPFGPIVGLSVIFVVTIGQNFEAIQNGNLIAVLSSYIGLPIFLAIWGIHALITKQGRLIPLDQIDVSGLKPGEYDPRQEVSPEPNEE